MQTDLLLAVYLKDECSLFCSFFCSMMKAELTWWKSNILNQKGYFSTCKLSVLVNLSVQMSCIFAIFHQFISSCRSFNQKRKSAVLVGSCLFVQSHHHNRVLSRSCCIKSKSSMRLGVRSFRKFSPDSVPFQFLPQHIATCIFWLHLMCGLSGLCVLFQRHPLAQEKKNPPSLV